MNKMTRTTFTCSVLLLFINQVTCQPTTGQSSDKIPRTGIVTSMLDMKEGKDMYNDMQYHGEVKLDGKTYVRTVTPAGRTERDLELGDDGKYLALINLLCVENNLNDCFDFLVVTSMGYASFGKFVAAAKLVRLADDNDLYQGVFVLNDMIEFVMKDAQCAVVDGKKMALVKTYDCSKSSFRPYTKVAPPLSPPASAPQYNDQRSDQPGPTKYPLGYTGAHPPTDNYPLSNGLRSASPPAAPQYNAPGSNQMGSPSPPKYPLGYTGNQAAADTYPINNGVRSPTPPGTNTPGYGSAPQTPSTYALGNPTTKPTGVRPSSSASGFPKPLGYTGAKPAASGYPLGNSDFTYPKDGTNLEDFYIS